LTCETPSTWNGNAGAEVAKPRESEGTIRESIGMFGQIFGDSQFLLRQVTIDEALGEDLHRYPRM
jgi:hypothetical protein